MSRFSISALHPVRAEILQPGDKIGVRTRVDGERTVVICTVFRLPCQTGAPMKSIFVRGMPGVCGEKQVKVSQLVRTCASCGCIELAACKGGCYWIGPNRCSECV